MLIPTMVIMLDPREQWIFHSKIYSNNDHVYE